MAKKGVARRTRLTVHDGFGAFRGRAAGNTSKTSPPLAGWKVRRLPSVPAAVSHEPFLAKVSRSRPCARDSRPRRAEPRKGWRRQERIPAGFPASWSRGRRRGVGPLDAGFSALLGVPAESPDSVG